MPDKIRYGQIGVGHAHASKLQVYRDSADYEVVGIAEPDPELRRRAESQAPYRDLPWMSVEQLLNQPKLQVVGIETRVADLLAYGGQAVDAGMHIHLDKPAGTSLPEFKQLLDRAARGHLAVQMGYMYRYNPGIVALRRLLDQGHLGQPFELHTVMSKLINDGARQPLAQFAGGSMFELGCHLIDLVVGILGAPEAVHPYLRRSREDQLRDNTLAVFEYPGATATVRSTLIEVDGGARRQLTLCGTKGTVHIQPLDRPRMKLTLLEPGGGYPKGTREVELPDYRRYVDDAAELARIVRHEQDPRFSYEHDLAVQKSLLLASGMPIE
ncbi:MAG: Gfo/Idh/MocA family oxidoreductase [Planctomycetales bacterium]|nr:Gfo/Idh/MocA family oxidoreductase [Planctomycetales bacterium]